ncbi:MAG TPA: glycoside hydrolase family 2 TIM barrel-domain containing protein, partial [Deinococcales bacterium]|nr:glycoside hydrolase family 2 TIM barrel-domain containing protein [Deinococcales bacterium]
ASDSMFRPLRLDLTGRLEPGGRHHLAVAVHEQPHEQPQIGRTSRTSTTKTRFGYWWDFSARLVNTGIWQGVRLRATGPARIEDVWVRPLLSEDHREATVLVTTTFDAREPGPHAVTVELLAPDGSLAATGSASVEAGGGASSVQQVFRLDAPALWWPNGHGEQPLYRCRVTVAAGGERSDERETSFGVRSIRLEANPWPPEGAAADLQRPLGYTFTVNGKRLLVKGWNIVPLDLMYGRHDLGERYAQLVRQARDSHANLLRVNGVGLIERRVLYDLCDRAGLMLWQEFTLSSSGIDNVPPGSPGMLERLRAEATAIIPLRRNHPSLAVWCGGNELTDENRVPASEQSSPALALIGSLVRALDPDRPYLPTSPTGPMYDLEDHAGLERPGEQHDVHGGWHYRGPVETYLGLNNSTALFHSEFGTQGAVAPSSLRRFVGERNMLPPDATNPIWVHHGAWWMQAHRVREVFGGFEGIEQYLRLSQLIQAEGLRYGIEANRRRWPRLSGVMPWQLNEPWPNAHNTCVVDYYGRPKMAYYWAKRALAPVAASLRYQSPLLRGGRLEARAFAVSEAPVRGSCRLTARTLGGQVLLEREWSVQVDAVAELGGLSEVVPDETISCRLELLDGSGAVLSRNEYLLGPEQHYLAGLLAAPATSLTLGRRGDDLVVGNAGDAPALFVTADIDDPRRHWLL